MNLQNMDHGVVYKTIWYELCGPEELPVPPLAALFLGRPTGALAGSHAVLQTLPPRPRLAPPLAAQSAPTQPQTVSQRFCFRNTFMWDFASLNPPIPLSLLQLGLVH